jgi:uncharacterized protein (DUF1330 family)|tara:strand:- start:135 stop:422 length:288 start_codon:yes stop_codon:yes gene_type:complete
MKAYWNMKVNVEDETAYKNYAEKATLAIEKFGGKYLVRGGKFEIVEGKNEFKRNVIVEFESFEIAKKCFNSKEYQDARSYRLGKADFNGIIIEGH